MPTYYLNATNATAAMAPSFYTLSDDPSTLSLYGLDNTGYIINSASATTTANNDILVSWQYAAAVNANSPTTIMDCSANITWWDPSNITANITVGNMVSYWVWPMTAAQREAEHARIEMERETRDTARARAEALLHRYLREDQRCTLQEHGWILVVSRTGNRYRVYRGRSNNVKLLDTNDREVISYCAHPKMVVPEADCMLSQMLMLELAEDRFLMIANKHSIERRMAA